MTREVEVEKSKRDYKYNSHTVFWKHLSLLLPYFHRMAGITFWHHPLFRRHSQSLQSTSPLQCLRILQCHSSSPWLSAKWSHRNGSANLTSHYPAQNPLWTEMSHPSEKIHGATFVPGFSLRLRWLLCLWNEACASGIVPSCIVQDNKPASSLSGQEIYLHALAKTS